MSQHHEDSIRSEQVDTLIIAGWVLPVAPAERVLTNHAVAIRAGRITAILPQAAAEHEHRQAREVIRLPGHVLLPGFVNAHGHLAMSLMRGYADDYSLSTWLQDYIWPLEQRLVDADFVQDGVELAVAEMLRSGTTCCSDMYFFPATAAACVQRLGMRAQVMTCIGDTRPYGNADRNIARARHLWQQLHKQTLLKVALGPHSLWCMRATTVPKIAALLEEIDMPLHIHLHETAAEVAAAERDNGCRPLTTLHAAGLLNHKTQCVHLAIANSTDIELLAKTGAHVIHCPTSNMKLAAGRCPVEQLQTAGVNIALGTDSAASNNSLDMLGEMRRAALLAKLGAGDATSLPAHEVLAMATINGAAALGWDKEIGSLEVGKAADLIALDLMQPETQPLHNPISQLVYAAHAHQVTHSWVAGRCLLRDRVLTSIDLDTVLARASARAHTLAPTTTAVHHSR